MNYSQFVCSVFCLLLFGCSKNNDDTVIDIDISSITGSYQIHSITKTRGGLCSDELRVVFNNDKECVTVDGEEYCRRGPLIINSDNTVSSLLQLRGFDYYLFSCPTGEVSISGNVATICLDCVGGCNEFEIEEDGLYRRYSTIGGCKVSMRFKKD